MFATYEIRTQSWYGDDGERLSVTCSDSGCLTEINVPGASANQLTAEVFVQPRDETGLPLGPVVNLCRIEVDLVSLPGRKRLVGRFWLPNGIRWSTAVNCYFRLSRMRNHSALDAK